MSNAAALASLAARADRLRSVPQALPAVARAAAPVLEKLIRANIAAGRAPDGTPWPASKDGGPVLVGALAAVDVRAVGATIVFTIDGVEARHHLGAVKGGVKRQIIPQGSLPAAMIEALQRVVDAEMRSRGFGAP